MKLLTLLSTIPLLSACTSNKPVYNEQLGTGVTPYFVKCYNGDVSIEYTLDGKFYSSVMLDDKAEPLKCG